MKLISKLTLAGILAGGLVGLMGCEKPTPEPIKPKNYTLRDGPVPEGQANVKGTWYDDGQRHGGYHYFWHHLRLRQNGTKVWGTYENEFYGKQNMEGCVSGNSLFLQESDKFRTNNVTVIKGIVNGESMKTEYRFFYENEWNTLYDNYNRISTNIITSPLGVF